MAASSGVLYITYVEKQGAFLRIWGQTDRNLPVIIEKSLAQMTPQFESGLFMPTMDGIQCGLLCCAKYKDGAYYRARITNIALLHQNVVEVHFVDYGNKDIIPTVNLRTIGNFAPGLITIPPQARDFILANVTHQGPAWDNDTIALVSSEIRYMELTWVLVSQVNAYTLIKLFKAGEDVALSFFNRGMVLSIATAAQHMILQSIGGNTTLYGSQISPPSVVQTVSPPVQVMAAPPPALLTYKAVSLEAGSENYVYISYVSDGPCHFSVQLKKLEDTLARLMKELNRMNLQPLEDDPIPGTVCVARCIEDEHICRAVVTSMVDGKYKVFYVDFGNTEVVPLDSLYQIPFKYVIPKVMAMRYALAGLDRSSVTLEMKCAFKEFVSDKLLRMQALPPPTRSALPMCSLWDDKNINVLDVLRQAALLAYPEVIQLTRGFSQEVRVSYVHSCSHFYVQIKSKEEELRKVMAELQSKCPFTNLLSPSQVKVGLPCCALFEADGQWYRAQILSKEGEIVKVRYVDYGNEESVLVNNLRMPPAEQLTALRPQALECCLNGYQNMADDLERDNILEELILEKEFVMKVVEMQGNRALVDLIDSSRYNVGSLLLERLANAKSQVSPLLIQDGHHIEHRKRKSPIQQRLDHRPMRNEQSNKEWNNEERERKPWNNQDKERNNSRQDSWRQGRPPRKDQGDERNGGDNFDRSKGRRDAFKKDNWGGSRDEPEKDSWGGDREEGFKKDNWGEGKEGGFKKDKWGEGRERGGKKDNWGEGREGGGFKKDNWGGSGDNNRRDNNWSGGGESQWKRNGKSSNQREGSEKSFSDGGSEKNWRRSPRSTNFNEDKRPKRKFDSGGKNTASWNSTNNSDGFNSNNTFTEVANPAPSSAVFVYPELVGRSEKVLISWFHDPAHFFCQLQEHQAEFRTMMNNIQTQYSNIKPTSASVGTAVIALYPDDGVMYRALVLEIKGMQYRVQYIDFGNVATTDKVWPIDNKLMQLSAQAICCSLQGLAPLADKWANADAFSTHFDKECFLCTFIASENQNYSVELTCDNQSVSEALVLAGLARYDEALAQDNFDPSMLLGQQMRVVLGEVQSLDDFYVQLQNGIQIVCTMHNLALATQTYEDTLKQSVGSILIMYVDNVLQDKTEITLYDTSGVKLKIVEPDETAYDTIEMLCPMPVLSNTISGWISYLKPGDSEKFRVFIQPPEYADNLAQLLEDLFNHYDASEETELEPTVWSIYAVHSSDGNWYRGQVVKVDDETITVIFVDYGNSESVPVSNLRKLEPEFMQQHLMALELLASGVDETFIENEVIATVWFGENGWEAEIQKTDQSLSQTQPAVKEIPIEEQPAETNEEAVVQEEAPPAETIQPAQVGVPVILSHTDSPSEFYVQLSEDVETINSLQETLQEQVSGFADLESPAAGVLCAAPYSVDQQWYRAQVLDADVDITTVRFVDYGNTDVLTNVANHVKTLPPDLLSLEQHARRCSLIVKASDSEWSPAAFERFEVLTTGKNLSAEIVHQDEKTTYLELFADGQNVAETLLQEGLAVKLQLETESSCSGYVSHLNSPSEFWVQLENSVADLEWIAEQLSAAETFLELEDLTPGSLCAALFPDDEMWYRARILSNTVAGLEVLFIDYGNSCTCTGLRQLPEDLIMLPALAQKCSLQKPSGILQWSPQATEEFRLISADGATIFNIDRLSTGETSIVKLILDEVDVATKLLPKTEDAVVSHFESVSSFWLQKAEDIPKLETVTEKLTKASEWPKYEQKEECDIVVALYVEDEQWYRARIFSEDNSEYQVLFIDFGNTSTVTDIRKPMCDIEKESPLATKSKLEPLPGFRWNEESSKQFAEISNNGVTIFQVEVVAADSVRLYLNGNDIRSNLHSTYVSSAQNTPRKSMPMKTDADVNQGVDFVDTDSELVVISDTNVENSLTEEEAHVENNQDDGGAEIESAEVVEDLEATKFEEIDEGVEETKVVELVPESAEGLEVMAAPLKNANEECKGLEDSSKTADLTNEDKPVEITLENKEDIHLLSNEIVSSGEDEVLKDLKENTSSGEDEVVKDVKENASSGEDEVLKDLKENTSSGEDEVVKDVKENASSGEDEVVKDVKENASSGEDEVVKDVKENASSGEDEVLKDLKENTSSGEDEVVKDVKETASSGEDEVVKDIKENASSGEDEVVKDIKETASSGEDEVVKDIKETASSGEDEVVKDIKETASSGEDEVVKDIRETASSGEDEVVKDIKENASSGEDEVLKDIKENASSGEDEVVKNIKEAVQFDVEESTLEASTAAKTSELVINKLDTSTEESEEKNELTTIADDIAKKLDDEVLEQNSEKTLQDSHSEEAYIPTRRASTPHAEKIVPGAICRGDLTEVSNDISNDDIDLEEATPALNKTEENETGQCEQVMKVSSAESKGEKQVKDDISSNTSFCKIDPDERIVPASISRGETPEPSPTEESKTVFSAVNGLEFKDN